MEDDLNQATLDDDTAAPPEDNQVSMDDTIAQTWADIQARDSAGEDEPPTDTRPRDAAGKFAPRNPAPADAPPADSAAAPEPSAAAPAPDTPPSDGIPEWMRMGLRKDEAEAVARAPKEAQAAFTRRMLESQEGLKRMHEQLGPRAQVGDSFAQAVEPFMPTIQKLGLAPQQAVQKLFEAEHGLRYGSDEQRATHALSVLNSYGINLQHVFAIASGQMAPAQQQVAAPQAQTAAQPTHDLNRAVDEAVESRFLQREIATFKSQPGHEHFEELRPVMASLIQAGHADGLEDAYDQALRAHPVHGSAWLAQQLAGAEAARKAESQRKAQEARRAAAPNVSRRGTTPAAKPVGTIEDTIRDEAIRLGLI